MYHISSPSDLTFRINEMSGALDEKYSLWTLYLNIWSPASRTVGDVVDIMGDGPLLVKYVTRGGLWAFIVLPYLLFAQRFVFVFEDFGSPLPAPAASLPLVVMALCYNGLLSLWNPKSNKHFLSKLLVVIVFDQASRKVTNTWYNNLE